MPQLTRRALTAGLAATLLPWSARAQPAYPERPVTLIVPFSAGGAADIAGRTLAAHAPRHLPAPSAGMVVENRTGASGAVGTGFVARAKPDGQTLLLARIGSSAILPATDPRTPYAWDEFSMLGLLDENPFVVCVPATSSWKTLGELAAALREGPGRLNFATTGPATLLDLGVRHLFASLGLPIDAGVAIPFRGGADAVAAVLGGQAQFIGNNLSDMAGAIAGGQLRALVVGTADRLPSLPGVPTAREADVEPLARIAGWNALFGPPGLPEPVIAAWAGAIARLRQDRDWLAATRRVGSIPRLLEPDETREYVRAQVALYRELAKRLGLV
ncbi:Bug family tripartite tricarboxylate transporter substrate binding protein [Belnapia rosea]|uniref:Tripartite-type tricarboxylate transporter, receptor component TctC n=1 Tax=Belnapia rosea TaxID=938405 RepID=A0A1G7B8C7_9PROT|nr:tripartite tricarboxylate transporter substrate binding protein [Belnapia rosea]SDB32718.1 Tripartite-type tricarboxylate transporter, receptor component TctC [Belnapia rosea]SDE22566.1 Tripartite-type tricarboxylate transporter, receptor component TctC [Belnapia rosea]